MSLRRCYVLAQRSWSTWTRRNVATSLLRTGINMSFLVKDTVPSYIFFSAYDHASTDYSATRKRQISEGRAMRRKGRAKTRLVNWITVTIVTYHYDYNIVPPQ